MTVDKFDSARDLALLGRSLALTPCPIERDHVEFALGVKKR